MDKVIPLKGLNVNGEPLAPCCQNPKTGFYRDGFCRVGEDDVGNHSVCVVMNREFLEFSAKMGNDLSTPHPEHGFPGLKPGDRWCLCASRWKEAYDAGVAPAVILESTSEAALQEVSIHELRSHVIN